MDWRCLLRMTVCFGITEFALDIDLFALDIHLFGSCILLTDFTETPLSTSIFITRLEGKQLAGEAYHFRSKLNEVYCFIL